MKVILFFALCSFAVLDYSNASPKGNIFMDCKMKNSDGTKIVRKKFQINDLSTMKKLSKVFDMDCEVSRKPTPILRQGNPLEASSITPVEPGAPTTTFPTSTAPGQPTSSVTPTEPGQPTGTNSVTPTEPGQPTGTNSVTPTEPGQPTTTNPVTPTEPGQPTGPSHMTNKYLLVCHGNSNKGHGLFGKFHNDFPASFGGPKFKSLKQFAWLLRNCRISRYNPNPKPGNNRRRVKINRRKGNNKRNRRMH